MAARPVALSVTEIGTWLRNPYAIYAKHVLRLRKLDELDPEPDAATHGNLIHAALEIFAQENADALPPDAEARLIDIGRKIFSAHADDARVQAFWWPRFVAIAHWFVAQSRERSALGIKLLKAEASGKIALGGFTLKGRADRIDLLPDGHLAIADYKTGGMPSKTQVEAGIEPQLPLLALIAAQGGFEGIAASASGELLTGH